MPKCAICRTPYKKLSMTHKLCGNVECGIEWAEKERAKKDRQEARLKTRREAEEKREHRKKVERLKTRREYINEAQRAFNAYIRERDRELPCICCGRTETTVTGLKAHGWDCGHYRSVGSAPHLRFNENNAHRQLVLCNRYGAGRAVDYRIGLAVRIGIEAVEALEADQSVAKWSIPDLVGIRDAYRLKLRELKKERE